MCTPAVGGGSIARRRHADVVARQRVVIGSNQHAIVAKLLNIQAVDEIVRRGEV